MYHVLKILDCLKSIDIYPSLSLSHLKQMLTIWPLNNNCFSRNLECLKDAYEDLFDQNDLDYEQPQEALFITDTANLIAINNENNFQVLTQTDLANCVQQDHVYLCDKQHVVHMT
jgi:hypothetical protein